MKKQKQKKPVPLTMAVIPIIAMCIILGIGFGKFRYSVEVLLLISAAFAGILAWISGTSWDEMIAEINNKVGQSFGSFAIIIIVGLLIGTWMLSGTIPMMIYYGLQILSPKTFLVCAFVITAIVSVCTGTSFGSAGTVGLALIGIASGLGVNLAAAAGAIVSGAYFGDKMSPLSDTTNLAPVAAGSELYEHIAHMFWTTGPATLLCLIVYFIAGNSTSITGTVDQSVVIDICDALSSIFSFNILLLLPIVIIIVGSLTHKPTIPIMLLSSLVACALAIALQHNSVGQCLTACFSGYSVKMSGLADPTVLPANVLTLLQRGGMNNMMATILKILASFGFAGIMTAAGFMDVILDKVKGLIRSTGTLILVTAVSGVILSIIIGNAYVPILIVGEMYSETFKKMGLKAKNLSRTLEDSVTVIVPLAPWTAGGAYMSSALGVETFAYLPWAILNYTCVIFAVIYGFTGIGIAKCEAQEETVQEALA